MEQLQINSIHVSGYVVIEYDGIGWLGYTMAVDAEAGSVTVKFLHPHIPSSAFTFPDPQDVDISDIITQVSPTTTTALYQEKRCLKPLGCYQNVCKCVL
jgi:hypothetical protein